MISGSKIREEAIQAALATGFTRTALEHATNPRNVGSLEDADGYACVIGPCADSMTMWLKVRDGRITAIKFWTDGCGPTIATGSVTTELVTGRTLPEVMRLRAADVLDALGGLPEGHHHCAQLAVDTLRAALRDYRENRDEPWKKAYQAK